ncbi:MAG: PadR family transcriptional regulator [Gemmatimonadetes bacterium]|nr:PadR family transcriptional regulator [Gemmatimonadota bacterium]
MAQGPLYGYALKEAVEEESDGALTPRAGTLYRVIARLMHQGVVEEAEAPSDTPPHPGRARRYYALTPEGRGLLSEESARLRAAAALAEQRLGAVEGG